MDIVRIGNKIIVPGRFEVTTTRLDVLNTACILEAQIRELKQKCDESKLQRNLQTRRMTELDKELTELRVQAQRQKVATRRLEKGLREIRVRNGVDVLSMGDMIRSAGNIDDSFAAENQIRFAFAEGDITQSSDHRILGPLSDRTSFELDNTSAHGASTIVNASSDLHTLVVKSKDRKRASDSCSVRIKPSSPDIGRRKRAKVSCDMLNGTLKGGNKLERAKTKTRWVKRWAGKKTRNA